MADPAVLGIIPARGGSKGVLRKNIRPVAGLPLISYSINAARESETITHFVTSTDDAEIAQVAAHYGSAVVMRPAEFARDDTPMLPVVLHALERAEQEHRQFDYIVLLQPTTPLRSATHIDAAVRALIESGADSLTSVYQVGDAHPARMYRIKEGRLTPYDTEPRNRLRQHLEPVYHRNGAVYACRRDLLVGQGVLLGEQPLPFIMSREDSVNIDDEFDLAVADLMLRRRREGIEAWS